MDEMRRLENDSAKAYIAEGEEQRKRLMNLYNAMIRVPSCDADVNLLYRLKEIIGHSFPHGYGHAADYLYAVAWLGWPTNRVRG